MKHFPQRLKAARKMRGWSLLDFSKQMGEIVSKQALSQYEAGEIQPSGEVIVAICKALGMTTDFFAREEKVAIEKMSFRKLKKLAVKEQDRVVASAQDFVNRYLELETILNIKSAVTPEFFQVKNDNDIEVAAESLRKKWKIGIDPIASVIELLEDHKIKVFEINAEKSFSGMSTWINDEIPVIVLNCNAEIPDDRKRFTALHELGHLFLDLENYPEKEQENFCNHFAGAMLIPKDILYKEVGEHRNRIFFQELGQLKIEYGISLQAMLFRLKQLEVISESYFKFLQINFSKFGYRITEPFPYSGNEKSGRFLQLLLRGVAEEIISTSKAASLRNEKLAVFRKLLA